MYRVQKVLGNNALLAIQENTDRNYLILGKGVGFGKKVAERIELSETETAYSLRSDEKHGDLEETARTVDPCILEICDMVLNQAEKVFGKVDRSILFPMADHIRFAIVRLKRNETIRNPMIQDIKMLFEQEYNCACLVQDPVQKHFGVRMNEDEIGYVALHVHSAMMEDSVSQAVELAQAVHMCIDKVEKYSGTKLDMSSISYNRLMNHVRYMILRARTGEVLKLSMNDYMEVRAKRAFELSLKICDEISQELHCTFEEAEIGYLAMHIERVLSDLETHSQA